METIFVVVEIIEKIFFHVRCGIGFDTMAAKVVYNFQSLELSMGESYVDFQRIHRLT